MRAWLAWLGAVVAVAVLSVLLVGALRRYALARQLLDVPNCRSSHTVPTPRGGGVGIVASVLPALFLSWAMGVGDGYTLVALSGAGGLVASIGFVDDHRHVDARWRLTAHFAAAAWALYWLAGAPALPLIVPEATDGLWAGLALVGLVWLLNLYNFMDGIDGIAGVEAVSVGVGAALLHGICGLADMVLPPLLLAGATAGFLYWNFPPARIFMGDAGSGFLGIALGVMSLQAVWAMPRLFWAWMVLLGVFVVDATFTLMRRLLRREKVYQAHRSHAYQHAALACGGHRPVTLAVLAINVLWLLPLALLVGLDKLDGRVVLVAAYFPLLVLAVRFRAGAPS